MLYDCIKVIFLSQVPLGLLFKSEQNSAEISEIMQYIQEKYIPQSYNEKGEAVDVVRPILFGGDQLTEERMVNVKKSFLNGKSKLDRLDGIVPKFEDWHLKRTFYEVR